MYRIVPYCLRFSETLKVSTVRETNCPKPVKLPNDLHDVEWKPVFFGLNEALPEEHGAVQIMVMLSDNQDLNVSPKSCDDCRMVQVYKVYDASKDHRTACDRETGALASDPVMPPSHPTTLSI